MHYCAALYIEDVHTSVYLFHVKDNPNPKLHKEHRTLLYCLRAVVVLRVILRLLKTKRIFIFRSSSYFFLRKGGTSLYGDNFWKGVEKMYYEIAVRLNKNKNIWTYDCVEFVLWICTDLSKQYYVK